MIMPIVPVYVGVVKSVLGYGTRKESPNSLGTLFVKAVCGGSSSAGGAGGRSPLAGARGVPAKSPSFSMAAAGGARKVPE